jgi:hypothetical protein
MSSAPIDILRQEKERKSLELASLIKRARALRAEIKAIEDGIEVLAGSFGLAGTKAASGAPMALKHLIANILTEKPGQAPAEISQALSEVGRTADVNTVLVTLSRARKEGIVHKVDKVWFAGSGQALGDIFS